MEFITQLQDGHDELKPSLFELLSEQQLSALLPPSLRYLLALATYRQPRYLIHLLNSFDEAYALLSLLVEYHYLRTYGGTFTENFYGLSRARVVLPRPHEIPRAQLGAPSSAREALKLRSRDVYKNLALAVLLPYVKRKLDEGHDIHAPAAGALLLGPQYQRDTLPPGAGIKLRILYTYKWFLRRVYPHVNAAYYVACLAFQLAYLFDGSRFHSPFLWLVGTRMRRLGEADYRAFDAAANPPPAPVDAKSKAHPPALATLLNPRMLAATVGPRLLDSMKILLPTSIFALKFLEWWHASDFARQLSRKAAEGLELPPPVVGAGGRDVPVGLGTGKGEKDTAASAERRGSGADGASRAQGQQRAELPRPPISTITHLPIFTVPATAGEDSHLCPICVEPIVTATASPYGHVYCYVCIHKWVAGEHERQARFMAGEDGPGEEVENVWDEKQDQENEKTAGGSREGRWEDGRGRDAVSGRRCLGGTESLRRVVV